MRTDIGESTNLLMFYCLEVLGMGSSVGDTGTAVVLWASRLLTEFLLVLVGDFSGFLYSVASLLAT